MTLERNEFTPDSSQRVNLPEISLNDRVAIFGGTGSGKSILAQVLYRSIPYGWWKIIIDITDSVVEPSAATFYDPTSIPWDIRDEDDRPIYALRYVPDIDVNLEAQISTLYMNIFYHGACWVWLDEANEVSSAHRTAFGLRKVLLQGRKAYVGHVSCTPRPADISKSIVTQAQYFAIFHLVDYDDRIRTARYIGMTPDEFDGYMEQLPEYEYLLYDVVQRTLYQVPPVPMDVVLDILNPPASEEIPEAPAV